MKKYWFGGGIVAAAMSAIAVVAWAQGSNVSPLINDLSYAMETHASDIATATTSDRVLIVDVSDTPDEVNYGDGNNILEVIGVTSTAAELNVLDGVTATAAEINLAADISANFEVVAATNTLTTAECGKTMTLANATEFVSTLPALTAGCSFRFIVGAAPSGADYTIVSGTNVIEGTVVVNGAAVPGANENTISFVSAAALVGDWVYVVSDGTSWFATGIGNGAGAITFTAP